MPKAVQTMIENREEVIKKATANMPLFMNLDKVFNIDDSGIDLCITSL